MTRIAIAGYRTFENERVVDFISHQYLSILRNAKMNNMTVTAISAIAEGADTLFAEAALYLDIPLEVVRPFAKYASDFETKKALTRYEKLLIRASKEVRLPFDHRSDEAYRTAMYWIVENCDILVATWNGKASATLGGTKDAVERAIFINRPWIHIDVIDLSVSFHLLD